MYVIAVGLRISGLLLPRRYIRNQAGVASLACFIWVDCVYLGYWKYCTGISWEAYIPWEFRTGKIWVWGISCQLHCHYHDIIWGFCHLHRPFSASNYWRRLQLFSHIIRGSFLCGYAKKRKKKNWSLRKSVCIIKE